jgi:hypothetical protein
MASSIASKLTEVAGHLPYRLRSRRSRNLRAIVTGQLKMFDDAFSFIINSVIGIRGVPRIY